MAIHFTNLKQPKSFAELARMNIDGTTSGLSNSTNKTPWVGNYPGFAGGHEFEDWDGAEPNSWEYEDEPEQ